jgi:hypothetical protein
MSRYCKVCGVEIDPRRIAILPDTQTCTQHSTAEKKVAMVVQMGEGDHTWTETYAVDREVYDKIQEVEKNWRKTTKIDPAPKLKSTDEEDETPEIDDFIPTDEIAEDELEIKSVIEFDDEIIPIDDTYVDDEGDSNLD